MACDLWGRSPRTRGSHPRAAPAPIPSGSIPAHAGEPLPAEPARWPARVDPRARGGASSGVTSGTTRRGRSPRTRGSPSRTRLRPTPWGSIPAHAGEPTVRTWPGHGTWVDPRARGGASQTAKSLVHVWGRSPRTRGSRSIEQRLRRRHGSIPAHAGEPPAAPRRTARTGVDPRARGGARGLLGHRRRRWGRSPRTRGSPRPSPTPIRPTGSIPAHAGEPRLGSAVADADEVDPRARGEAPGLRAPGN